MACIEVSRTKPSASFAHRTDQSSVRNTSAALGLVWTALSGFSALSKYSKTSWTPRMIYLAKHSSFEVCASFPRRLLHVLERVSFTVVKVQAKNFRLSSSFWRSLAILIKQEHPTDVCQKRRAFITFLRSGSSASESR